MSHITCLKNLNSEVVLKDFSTFLKQEVIDHALNHKADFTSNIDTIVKVINALEEKDLLALYIKGHSYDEDIIDFLVQSQDNDLPF